VKKATQPNISALSTRIPALGGAPLLPKEEGLHMRSTMTQRRRRIRGAPMGCLGALLGRLKAKEYGTAGPKEGGDLHWACLSETKRMRPCFCCRRLGDSC
jgi:hypothetical protein